MATAGELVSSRAAGGGRGLVGQTEYIMLYLLLFFYPQKLLHTRLGTNTCCCETSLCVDFDPACFWCVCVCERAGSVVVCECSGVCMRVVCQ